MSGSTERTQRRIKQARSDRAKTARLSILGYGPDEIARIMDGEGDENATADRAVSDLRNAELGDFSPRPEGMGEDVYKAAKVAMLLELARNAIKISGDAQLLEKIEDLTNQLEALTASAA